MDASAVLEAIVARDPAPGVDVETCGRPIAGPHTTLVERLADDGDLHVPHLTRAAAAGVSLSDYALQELERSA